MSTRAVYTFTDANKETFHVYKHHDGYPSGACEWIEAAKGRAWPLPRFEADEFGAAFVAANKPNDGYPGGGVRLMPCGDIKKLAPMDIAYWYDIKPKGQTLHVSCYSIDNWEGKFKRSKVFSGPLESFAEFVKTYEEA